MNIVQRVSAALLLLASTVNAGTVVESGGYEGETSVSRIQGGKVRSDAGEPGTYLLLDAERQTAYLVNDNERSVIDMSGMMWGADTAGNAQQQPKARLVKQGKGPKIAGYTTVHYKLMVGDTHCGDEYLASQPLQDENLRRFGEVMSRMAQTGEQMGGGMMGMTQDPCDGEHGELFETYLDEGMPMRSIDRDGTLSHEVISIRTNVSMSASEFKLPSDYEVMDMQEMIQEAMSNMPAMQEVPGAQEMPESSEIDMSEMQKLREQAEEQMKRIMEHMEKQQNTGN